MPGGSEDSSRGVRLQRWISPQFHIAHCTREGGRTLLWSSAALLRTGLNPTAREFRGSLRVDSAFLPAPTLQNPKMASRPQQSQKGSGESNPASSSSHCHSVAEFEFIGQSSFSRPTGFNPLASPTHTMLKSFPSLPGALFIVTGFHGTLTLTYALGFPARTS